jgi:TolA-binding protein
MRSNADFAQRVDSLQEQIEALSANLELTNRRLQEISQQLASARVQLAPTGSMSTVVPDTADDGGEPAVDGGETPTAGGDSTTNAAAMASASPDELYRTAYEDYMRGNYDLAAQGFAEYLRRFPSTGSASATMRRTRPTRRWPPFRGFSTSTRTRTRPRQPS